jgi:hypothetical protein
MTTGKTLEEARKSVRRALIDSANHDDHEEARCKRIFEYLERDGFVILNKTLTVAQRTAAHNALTLHKYEIQPAFDAILAGVPK